MKYTAYKELKFDAAHRLLNYEGKCRDLHGHTYQVVVELSCEKLDANNFVVDFGVITALFQTWLDENLDHNVALNADDPLATYLSCHAEFRDPFIMETNPTAEAMSKLFHETFSYLLAGLFPDGRVALDSVEVFETPTASCRYSE